MPSVATIKACLNALYFTGTTRLFSKQLRGRGTIFCLHHVLPTKAAADTFAPNANLETTPEFLEGIIKLVRKRGYETVSLAEAISRLQRPDPHAKPFAVFTLDDGYKDNQIHAQPIFQKLNCPYTVFVVPGIIEGTTELWWRALEMIIGKNPTVHAVIGKQQFDLLTASTAEKISAWNTLYPALRDCAEYEQRKIIRELSQSYGINLAALCKSLAMNWDELKILQQDPLCTIGAHSLGHYLVAKLSRADAKHEMLRSREIITKKLSRAVEFFAYPYGDEAAAGSRDFKLAQETGYAAAVTTRKGAVFPEHINHLQALPRTMISARYAKIHYIDALLSGVPTFLLNKFNKLNIK